MNCYESMVLIKLSRFFVYNLCVHEFKTLSFLFIVGNLGVTVGALDPLLGWAWGSALVNRPC